jgi:hypothetical protein
VVRPLLAACYFSLKLLVAPCSSTCRPPQVHAALAERIAWFCEHRCSPRQARGDLMSPGHLFHISTGQGMIPGSAASAAASPSVYSGAAASGPSEQPSSLPRSLPQDRVSIRPVPPAFFAELHVLPDLLAHHSHRAYSAALTAAEAATAVCLPATLEGAHVGWRA